MCLVHLVPGSLVSHNDLVSLVRQLFPSLLLLLGDPYLRHPLWGIPVTSPHTNILTSLLPAFYISCLNDGLPTHHQCQTSSLGEALQQSVDMGFQ